MTDFGAAAREGAKIPVAIKRNWRIFEVGIMMMRSRYYSVLKYCSLYEMI